MKILVCNVGSTSLKFKLYDMPSCAVLAQGWTERVGSDHDAVFGYRNILTGGGCSQEKQHIPDYQTGISRFLECLTTGEDAVRRGGDRARGLQGDAVQGPFWRA